MKLLLLVKSYLKDPKAIREALSSTGLAQKIAGVSEDLGVAAGHLSAGARSALNPRNAPLTTKSIAPAFEGAFEKYLVKGKPATALDESAIRLIDDQAARLMKIADTNNGVIPEPELRTIIDKLQKDKLQ